MRLDVQIKAQLENVSQLHLELADDWYFKTKCTACNEEHENVIFFNLLDI